VQGDLLLRTQRRLVFLRCYLGLKRKRNKFYR